MLQSSIHNVFIGIAIIIVVVIIIPVMNGGGIQV